MKFPQQKSVMVYEEIKKILNKHGVTCGGYTSQGSQWSIINSLCQLTVDTDKPLEPQILRVIKLYK